MKNNIKGFTLVELLVALAISGLVLGAVFKIFNTSQQSYVVQEEVAEMQQNLRVAKMFLERDVRMAGAGVMNMSGPIDEDGDGNVEIVSPLEFLNADGADGTDKITVIYEDLYGGGCGTPPAGVQLCSDLPNLSLAGSMPPSSTTAEVTEEFDDSPYDQWLQDCYCNGTTYTATSHYMPFIVTSPDKSSSAILIDTKTSNNGGGSLDNLGNGPNTKPETPNESFYDFLGIAQGSSLDNKLLNTFPSGSTIKFFNTNAMYKATYYIEDENGIPCLKRDTLTTSGEIVAEHIEDLQGSFGLDTTGDGDVDAWINNADLTKTQEQQVRMAVITLSARTAHEHRNFSSNRPAIEDHSAGIDDGYRRRMLSFTIKIRNFGL